MKTTLGREDVGLANVSLCRVNNRVALLAMSLMNLRRVCFTGEYYNEASYLGIIYLTVWIGLTETAG